MSNSFMMNANTKFWGKKKLLHKNCSRKAKYLKIRRFNDTLKRF